MTAVKESGGKITPELEAALAKGRADVAAAEAALKEAEAQLLAARAELEKAIAELPDGELKDQLKRERNFPSLVPASGLHTIKFDTNSGQVTVNLPDDMMAGDTISGTVIAEPKGQTQEERTKNKAELQTYVVAIFPADPRPPKTPPIVTFDLSKGLTQSSGSTIVAETFAAPKKVNVGLFLMPNQNSPIGACGRSGSLVAINESCSPISQLVFTVPSGPVIANPMPTPTLTFVVPTMGQTGKPVVITGPFDGDSTNTGVTFQPVLPDNPNALPATPGTTFPVIAESPRQCVVASPTNVTGPLQVTVNEGGKQTTSPFRNVAVTLSAPKTSLLKGEQTTLTVQVSGLDGIKKPVPLTLESKGVITMEGGTYQPLMIQPSQVGADGRYTTTRGITGIQAGGWNATATVVTHRFNVCLQDDTAPARRVLWNTVTGDYTFTNPFPPPGQPSQTGNTTPPSLTGTGKVIMKGCILTLEHNAPDRRVMSRLDTCSQTGSASVETSPPNSPKVKFMMTDKNTTDNTCTCPQGVNCFTV